jgi:hypothetical protein
MAKRRSQEGKSPKKASKRKVVFEYPKHAFRPEDLLNFVELPVFTKRWEALGLNDEDDLLALQLFIMASPKRPKPIRGTGGIRKLRFAPQRWKTGKSGAARVLYVYFQEHGLVLLCLVYGKNEVDNISEAVKRYLNKLVHEVECELRLKYSGN